MSVESAWQRTMIQFAQELRNKRATGDCSRVIIDTHIDCAIHKKCGCVSRLAPEKPYASPVDECLLMTRFGAKMEAAYKQISSRISVPMREHGSGAEDDVKLTAKQNRRRFGAKTNECDRKYAATTILSMSCISSSLCHLRFWRQKMCSSVIRA